MRKAISLILAGIVALSAGSAVSAGSGYEYFDKPPFDQYKVSPGDSLFYIGKRYGVSLNDLYRFNPDVKGDYLEAGAVINLTDHHMASERTVLSAQDRDLLERLVFAEAQGQAYEGKVAVAEVVLNRVDSSQFPNTVRGVILEQRQFTPVATGTINNNPSPVTARAVQEALEGSGYARGALFFWNPAISTSRWLESKTVVTVIDEHEFLK